MYGSQTTNRQMEQLFNMEKGLLSSLDIGLQPPNALTFAQNAVISGQPGAGNTPMAVFTSPPLAGDMFQTAGYTNGDFSYQTVPYTNWIATLEPYATSNETIVFTGTGTGTLVNSISQGDRCISLACTASQTSTATDTVGTPHPLLPNYPVGGFPLKIAVDTNWTGHANFSSGTIRIGLDASNYFFWNLVAPAADGNTILLFDPAAPSGTVGTPGPGTVSPYVYVLISITASSGGALTVLFSNVREEPFAAAFTYRPNASNIYSAYPFISQKSTNARQLVLATANTLLIQTVTNTLGFNDNGISVFELKTGFTNNSPAATNGINNGSFFVFCQFPQVLNQDLNNLYYVNGSDGYFVYDKTVTNVPPVTISGLTQSGGVATAVATNTFTAGQYINVAGANQAGYNIHAELLTASGSGFTYQVDPATAATATGSPVAFASKNSQISTTKFTCMAAHKNYMWLAGDPLNPNTITPSILATPDELDSASAITIADPSGSSFITALVPFDDYLIIFRNTDVWIMLGTTTGVGGDIAIRRTQSQYGALNVFSAVNTGDTVYHYNGKVVCKFTGVTSQPISNPVSNYMIVDNVNQQFFTISYDKTSGQLYFFMPFGTQANNLADPIIGNGNPFVLAFDPSLRAWSMMGFPAGASGIQTPSIYYSFGGFSYVSTFGTPIYYQYGVNVQGVNTRTVGAQNYGRSWKIRSTWNSLNSPYIWKDPAFVRIYIRSTGDLTEPKQATLNVYKDYDPVNIAFTTTFTPINGEANVNIGPGCQGKAWMFEIVTIEAAPSPTTGYSYLNTLVFSGYAPAWTESEVI